MLERLVLENFVALVTLTVTVVTVVVTVRLSLKQLGKDVHALRITTEKADKEHDDSINKLDRRVSVAETEIKNITGWQATMRDQIAEIYKAVVHRSK